MWWRCSAEVFERTVRWTQSRQWPKPDCFKVKGKRVWWGSMQTGLGKTCFHLVDLSQTNFRLVFDQQLCLCIDFSTHPHQMKTSVSNFPTFLRSLKVFFFPNIVTDMLLWLFTTKQTYDVIDQSIIATCWADRIRQIMTHLLSWSI